VVNRYGRFCVCLFLGRVCGGREVKLVGAQGGEGRDGFGVYARSMPAENTFSLAEDRTTTRTVGSSAMQSNAAPYSRQNLAHVNVINDSPFPLDRTRASLIHSLFIECVNGWPNGGRTRVSERKGTNYGV